MGLSLLDLPLPIRIVPAAPLNDEELIAFSSAHEPYRVERNADGEIIVMSPAGGETSNLEALLNAAVTIWADSFSKGVSFSPSGGFRLRDGSVLSPDAAWVAEDRWNALNDLQRRGFPPLCPDFLVELRSPSDSVTDLEEKMRHWIANGAQLAWLIDPIRKLAIIYRPNQQPETLNKPEVLQGEGPIAGFRLEMGRFWA